MQVETPNLSQWKELVEDIYIMEKLTLKLKLQEDQMDQYWWKWTGLKREMGTVRRTNYLCDGLSEGCKTKKKKKAMS